MTEFARKSPLTLKEFMDRANDFVKAKDTLQPLLKPRKRELKSEVKSSSMKDKKAGLGHQDRRWERNPNQQDKALDSSTIT